MPTNNDTCKYGPTISVDYFEHFLSGKTIAQLDTASIDANNLFLISRKDQTSISSLAVTYADLSATLAAECSSVLSLGSIAFEDTWRFAKVDHNHTRQYLKTHIDPIYDFQGEVLSTVCIATLSASDSSCLSIFSPIVAVHNAEPKIGTLKFVYSKKKWKTFSSADINSPNFDGWVYADGSIYEVNSSSRFRKALDAYGIGANKIQVPNLSSFLKASAANVDTFNEIPQQLGIAEHSHQVDPIKFTGILKQDSISVQTYKTQSKSTKYRSYIHHGKTDGEKHLGKVSFEFDMSQVQLGLSCSNYGSENQVFEPRNNALPVLIYIGGRL